MTKVNMISSNYSFKYIEGTNNQYRELDSIIAAPSAYIDTGYIANGNTSLDCKFMWQDIYNYNFAFGSGPAWNSNNVELYNIINAATVCGHYSGEYSLGTFTAMKPFRLVQQKNIMSRYDENGTLVSQVDAGLKGFNAGNTLWIFALHRDNCYTSKPQTCYYFKIWDNDALVRDYVPCVRVSDNVAGLYDKVNKTFVTSANGNPIIAGNDLIIEGSGKQHLNFNVAPQHIRKYYKYQPYIQPAFGKNWYEYDYKTPDNQYKHVFYMLDASHQSGPAYNAFNKSLTGDNCWWTAHGVTSASNPCWISFYSSEKIRVKRLTIMNENTSPENYQHGILQGSNNGRDWINLTESIGTNVGAYTTSIPVPEDKRAPYHWYRMYFDQSFSTGGVSIQIMTYEGDIALESTEDDYDFYEEYTGFKVEADNLFKFYKFNGTDKPVESTIEDYDYAVLNKTTFTPTN